MRRLLVTGGAGFIGTNYVSIALGSRNSSRVVVVDALTYAGSRSNIIQYLDDPAFRFVQGDICDTQLVEEILREERIDTIVNFAAESHVDRSILGPDAFVTTNVVGTHSLLKAARSVWLESRNVNAHRFHQVSTDEIYGSLGFDDPPFSERNRIAPNSPYSATKAAADHLVRAYHKTYGLKTTISCCSNNYGPYQFPEKMIPLMIINMLEGRALPVYGDGRNIRDWLHVSDHCRGIDLILESGEPGQVYNIGGGRECSNIELVRTLCGLVDAEFERAPELGQRFSSAPAAHGEPSETLISFVTDRPGHDLRYSIDCQKLQERCGYLPRVQLERGLADTLAWYISREDWWRALGHRGVAR